MAKQRVLNRGRPVDALARTLVSLYQNSMPSTEILRGITNGIAWESTADVERFWEIVSSELGEDEATSLKMDMEQRYTNPAGVKLTLGMIREIVALKERCRHESTAETLRILIDRGLKATGGGD